MKKTLAENLLRFAPKNLDAKSIEKLQQIVEQGTQQQGMGGQSINPVIQTQPDVQTVNKQNNVPEIPGFTWAEDDQTWLQSLGRTATIDEISSRNELNLSTYYNGDLMEKQILLFNPVTFQQKGGYTKQNLLIDYLFTCKKIIKKSPSAKTISISIMSSDAATTPYVQFMWLPTGKMSLRYHASNAAATVPDVVNSVILEICKDTNFQQKYQVS